MDSTGADDLSPNAYENCAGAVIAFVVVLLLVNLVVVGLRFYIRLAIIQKFGTDDWALAVTMLSTIGAAVGATSSTRFGLGGHIYILSLPERSNFLKLIWFAAIGYHVSIMLLKSTFLLQFRRVFPLPSFQRLCDFFLAFIVAWAVAGIVVAVVICRPISKSWDPLAPDRICEERLRFWLGHGVMHVITDVLIFLMPLPLLKTLPLPALHKGVLIGVFCLGFFTCAISAIRLTTLRASLLDEDATWTMSTTLFWSVGEVTCAIVCLCIPTLRPLVARCREFRRRSGRGVEQGQRHPRESSTYPRLCDTTLDRSHTSTRMLTRASNNDRRGEMGWDLEPSVPKKVFS